MSVYVGQLFDTRPTPQWRYTQACHLYADELEELLSMASAIGLPPRYLQHSRAGRAHFDLTANKRRAAIAGGAVPHSRRQEGDHIRAARERSTR